MAFRVAGESLVSDATASWLDAFVEELRPDRAGFPRPDPETLGANPGRLVFRGEAWLAGEPRTVACTLEHETYRLECAGARPFLVGPAGRWIRAEPLSPAPLDETELQILFGPALLLALARRGTFALHASAVATAFGVAAFVGQSGAGKSTLAQPAVEGWERVADDIVPVGPRPNGIVALPRFPQLKLGRAEQYPASAAAELRLAAVYEIEPRSSGDDVRVEPLPPADGALTLVAHTVAARTFGPELLERHLDFCTAGAASVRVRRLRVPRSLEALPAVYAAVRADLRSLVDAV
jgi:hypothetical protein